MKNRIPFQIWLKPVRYRKQVSFIGRTHKTSLRELCVQAGILVRATVPKRDIFVYTGTAQYRTPHADYVGVPVKRLTGPVAALRALEALAHSFHDHAARACVCKRNLFCIPTKFDAV